jgi:hypothetical protein
MAIVISARSPAAKAAPSSAMRAGPHRTWFRNRPRRLAIGLGLALLASTVSSITGCETQPVIVTGPSLSTDELLALVDASDWNGIADGHIACNESSDACAKAHATHADACLRLAIQLPADASAARGRTRRLLDNAESGYRRALKLRPAGESASLASYHGGLLLTLSERRNRLDAEQQGNKLQRENQKLLKAAERARNEVADSALGFIYGASALVYDALLREQGSERCNELEQAATMLARAPAPPRELGDEEQRLQALIERELQKNACRPAAEPAGT